MKKIKENQQHINRLVLKGKLPIAFFNSVLIKLDKNNELSTTKRLIHKYKQRNIPKLISGKVISKMYDIL